MNSIINVNFSAASEKGANGFVSLLRDNIPHESVWHTITSKEVKYNNGTMSTYWNGLVHIVIQTENLNSSLVQIDVIKSGLIPNSDDVMTDVFPDFRFETIPVDDGIAHLIQLNNYQQNKIQEQSRAIEMIENRLDGVITSLRKREQQVDSLQGRYDRLTAYVYDMADLSTLVQVVKETANEVDPDILDKYKYTVRRLH